jgi:hypothetical protein
VEKGKRRKNRPKPKVHNFIIEMLGSKCLPAAGSDDDGVVEVEDEYAEVEAALVKAKAKKARKKVAAERIPGKQLYCKLYY